MTVEAYSEPNEDWDESDWQEAREQTGNLMESLSGSIVGHFVLARTATNGGHPEAVRAAWVGVPLPVREVYADPNNEKVRVLCTDGFNALVEAEADEKVLQYWIDQLDGIAGPDATFTFARSDGSFAQE